MKKNLRSEISCLTPFKVILRLKSAKRVTIFFLESYRKVLVIYPELSHVAITANISSLVEKSR